MAPYTQYPHRPLSSGTEDTTRLYSPGIWADCPLDEIRDHGIGVVHGDQFTNFGQHISAQDVQEYASYIDTGVTILARTGAAAPGIGGMGGGIIFAGNDADNDEGVLSSHSPFAMVSDTASEAKKLWFECRFAKEVVTSAGQFASFVGLAFDHGAGTTIANTLALTDDDGDLGAFSYLGFHTDCAAPETLDCVYKSDAGAQTVNLAGMDTLVADTFVKCGFVYDPGADTSQRITWFLNGVPQTTYVTGANIAAAAFPDAEPLAFVAAFKTGALAAAEGYVDWWRCAQLF